MQVIVDYFQLSQMKSCRKEPQRSRNNLLQQRTTSFNKIQNSFLLCVVGRFISGAYSPSIRLSGSALKIPQCPSRYLASAKNRSQINGCKRWSIITLFAIQASACRLTRTYRGICRCKRALEVFTAEYHLG